MQPRRGIAVVSCVLVALALLCVTGVHAKANFGWASCDPGVVQSSGYIDIPGKQGTQKHYFYWLFGPRRWPADGSQPPVVLWMQGGPGCSSSFGMLAELGPCMMNETTGNLYYNPYGWNDEAYLLFVDQTAGVGFSYADKMNYDHNESEAAEDMYNFLQGFAKRFASPSITGANGLYITGESYGGHYVPSVAYRVLQGNQRGDGPVINLKGIAVGNGWTDPYTQIPSSVYLAYDFCKEKLGAPCINASSRQEMIDKIPICQSLVAQCNALPDDTSSICTDATTACNAVLDVYGRTGRNTYDIRKPCMGEECYDTTHADSFMRIPAVVTALGAKSDIMWAGCTAEVSKMFFNDIERNFNWTIPPLLAAGIRVVIYAGELDFMCNWVGNKAWVTALNWPGKAGFNTAPDVEFSVGGRAAGQERAYGQLSFVRFYDAGHMVPMDQPAAALHLVSALVKKQSLVGM